MDMMWISDRYDMKNMYKKYDAFVIVNNMTCLTLTTTSV